MQIQRVSKFYANLTDFSELTKKPCVYCNELLGESVRSGSGLDRIDNIKGYELDNVQPCCAICNKLREAQFTVNEMHAMVNAVVKVRQNRN